MERFFKRFSLANALLILVILVAIFAVLTFYATPAIKEYGVGFLTETGWGVIKQSQPSKNWNREIPPSTETISDRNGINMEEEDLGELGGIVPLNKNGKSENNSSKTEQIGIGSTPSGTKGAIPSETGRISKTSNPTETNNSAQINMEEEDLGGIAPAVTSITSKVGTTSKTNSHLKTDSQSSSTTILSQPPKTSSQSLPSSYKSLKTSSSANLSIATASSPKIVYSGLVPIVGTILSTIIALLFAVPIAMGIAIFLTEIAPPVVAKPVGIAIELLAAIPSIIYGMWGLFYFGPFISHIFGGSSVSLLVAGLVLGVMIIPFMASLTRDAMSTTPDVLKESAYGVGATKFEVIKDVIFPYAKRGIIGSIILALGRALGETMAVAFVIGGVFALPKSLTDPTVSIPVVLANNFTESSGMGLSALFFLALILFLLSFGIITYAKFKFLSPKKED